MALFADHTFTNETITLDGNHYRNCNFVGCTIVYRGGRLPIEGGTMSYCVWHIDLKIQAQRDVADLTELLSGLPLTLSDAPE